MPLILRRAHGHRKGDWHDAPDDYDVCDGDRDVGRIFLYANEPWFWGLGHFAQLDGKKRYGTVDTREQAMATFKAEYEKWLSEQSQKPA